MASYNPAIVTAFFKSFGIPAPEYEFKFHPERKWRFDLAWPKHLLYLECDGGVWVYGGHNRGVQMKKDWEKRNAATALGWRGLWVEPKEMTMTETAEMIKRSLSPHIEFPHHD